MKVLNKFVLIEPIISEVSMFSTATDMEKQLYQQGIVVSVSDLVDSVSEGDRVLYNQHTGHEQRLNDKSYFLIDERGLVAILDEGDLI